MKMDKFTYDLSIRTMTQHSQDEENKELVDLLSGIPKFNEVNDGTLFRFIGEGNSGKNFVFNYGYNKFGIKIYKKEITYTIPEITENDYLVKTEYFNKNGKTYAIFEYLEKYKSLSDWILHNICNRVITHCYKLDSCNRWFVIYKIIFAMYNLHLQNIYHRDIHPSNIIINPMTYDVKFIDLDTMCVNNEDCKKDLRNRVLQAKTYQIKNFNLENFTKYGYVYAQDLDYYAVGIVILEILNVNSDMEIFVEKLNLVSNNDDLNKLVLEEFFYNFYPSCSIHKKIFTEFYEMFLYNCLNDKYYKSLFINLKSIELFILKNFYKTNFISIADVLKAFDFNGNNNLMYHILTHSFYNYNIKMNYKTEDTRQYYDEKNDDFVIQGPMLVNPPDIFFYKCPYINLSFEPFRASITEKLIKFNNLPLLEINTYRNISCDMVEQYDHSLKSNEYISFAKNNQDVYTKFSCANNNFWIPYFVLFYIGQIDFNEEKNIKISRYDNNFDKRKVNFLYIASNCSNDIRETLFKKLRDKSDTAIALGKCQRTEDETTFIERQRGGAKWHDLL